MTEPWSERDSEFKSSRARARGLVAPGAGVGLLLALLFFIAQLFVTQPGAAARGVPLRVATGAAGGRYHQLGLALAERWGLVAPEIPITVMATGGTVHNLDLLAQGDVDVAFLAADVAYRIVASRRGEGDGREGLYGSVRLLGYAYGEGAHLILKGAAQGLEQLQGKRVAVGLAGSRDEAAFAAVLQPLLEEAGIQVHPQFIHREDALEQLQLGWIDGLFYLGPAEADLARRLTELRLTVGDLDEEAVEAAAAQGWAFPLTIPAGTYRPEPVRTFGTAVLLAVRADLDSEVVERLAALLGEQDELLPGEEGGWQPFPVEDWDAPAAGFPFPWHPVVSSVRDGSASDLDS